MALNADEAITKLNAIERRSVTEDSIISQIEDMISKILCDCLKDGAETVYDNFYGTIYRFSDGREIHETDYGWKIIKR